MNDRSCLNRRDVLRIGGLSILGTTAASMAASAVVSAASEPSARVLPPVDALHGHTPMGVQDFVDAAPSDVFAGPLVMSGQVVYRAVDGSWIELVAQSHWGSFVYVITRLGAEPGMLPRISVTPEAPAGALIARKTPWADIRTGNKAPLWLEGEITSTRSEGAELEGSFTFGNEIVRLGFKLIENDLLGADPGPTLRSVYYGPNVRQKLDVYLAKSTVPTPVAVFIHGGAWVRGDKNDIRGHGMFLNAGISVVAIDYRYLPSENPSASMPAVAIPLSDAARAIQFIRSKAAEWKIDKDRVGVWGVSAGACTCLWLGTHPDMADLSSSDPVLRESSRPYCVSAVAAQTSLDPEQMRAWVGPGLPYGAQAFGLKSFATFLEQRERLLPWIREYSPAALLSDSSAPIFLGYRNFALIPFEPLGTYYTHSPRFGIGFLKLAHQVGAECYLRYDGHPAERYDNWHQFLVDKLTEPNARKS